jgi:hypothetical protein
MTLLTCYHDNVTIVSFYLVNILFNLKTSHTVVDNVIGKVAYCYSLWQFLESTYVEYKDRSRVRRSRIGAALLYGSGPSSTKILRLRFSNQEKEHSKITFIGKKA